jgi:hypothetical protein
MSRNVSAFRVLLVSLAGLVTVADGADAAGCLDEVNRLAARYNLSSDPPDASPDKPLAPVRPGDMARSGGVIEPAPTPDKSVITPPRDAHDPMPTVPDVKGTPKKQEEAAAGKLDASEMTTLQSLLVAARAQAKRGVEAECMDRLREARELIGRSKR